MTVTVSELKLGDRVRIVIEGTVSNVFPQIGVRVGEQSKNWVYIPAKSDIVKSVEILSRKFKVGDEVILSKVGDRLPAGTVVSRDVYGPLLKRYDGTWTGIRGVWTASDLTLTRKIVFIPNLPEDN